MLDLLARKSVKGDISFNMAKQFMSKQEWGLARQAVEQALEKGGLSDPVGVQRLLDDISQRLGCKLTSSDITRE